MGMLYVHGVVGRSEASCILRRAEKEVPLWSKKPVLVYTYSN